MVQLKILLDTRRVKSDGTYPIVIRVTNVKEVRYIQYGISVPEDKWDATNRCVRKSYPNAATINATISNKFLNLQKLVFKLVEENSYTYDKLRTALNPSLVQNIQPTFLEFATTTINDMIAVKRTGNATVYLTGVNRLLKFHGNNNLKFEEITFDKLERFVQVLTLEGLRVNSISNYLRSIRALYRKGMKSKLVDPSLYPFQHLSIKTEKTAKRAILQSDLTKIRSMDLLNSSQEYHARNYFLLSFYLRGASFTDMAYLTKANIRRGRVEFRRRKTKKAYSILLIKEALEIIEFYDKDERSYLLPVLRDSIPEDSIIAKKRIHQWIKTTNKYLKRIADSLGIDSVLTTYVARHTWATTAKRMGYSNELIAEALGHEYGNKVTGIYLDDFDQDVIDAVNEKVTRL